ncbi:MAG: cation diffusion facilitator family transporter [Sphingomonas sp.]|nr:cation diffusion facilitator family transporter [Sphingomonas sp.]
MTSDRATLTSRAAQASIAVALFLLALKAWAAWRTGSVAMLGSLADTGLDLIASVIVLVAVRVAARPPDHEHRYGHGKAEALAALAQVTIISVSATAIGWRAVQRLAAGETTADAEYGIGVSLVAIAATLGLIAYQKHVIARTGSIAIRTDRLHYQSDLLLNSAVIAALVLDQLLGFSGADPLFGIAIAGWLLFGALRNAAGAIGQLMDRAWPDDRRRRLVEIVARHPEVRGVHDVRTRSSGPVEHAQFHIWVDPAMRVARAHDLIEAIEGDLAAEFPGVDAIVHVDPEGQVDEPGNPLAENDESRILKS